MSQPIDVLHDTSYHEFIRFHTMADELTLEDDDGEYHGPHLLFGDCSSDVQLGAFLWIHMNHSDISPVIYESYIAPLENGPLSRVMERVIACYV